LTHVEPTRQIIGAFYGVYNVLSYGFLETIYENAMSIELRSRDIPIVAPQHEPQLVGYLSAARYEVGLLLNFGPSLAFKRKIYDNDRKTYQPQS
jgi:hypothetical protein